MNIRRLLMAGLIGLAAVLVATAGAQEAIPEEAFAPKSSAEGEPLATANEDTAPLKAVPSEVDETLDHPTPFYKRWIASLFDLGVPTDPYVRDNFKFILGTSVGYDDNVLYSATNRITSQTYGVNGSAGYQFGNRRMQVKANLSGSVNHYENRPGGSDDKSYVFTLALQYQWMPRLGVSFQTYSAYLSQPSPQLIGGNFQFSGSYFYTDTSLNLNYQVRPRFSVILGYDVSGYKYEDQTINQNSGYYQQSFSLSGNWLISPRTTLILQYRYNPVTYYESDFGSTGQLLLVGIDQNLSPRLKYELLLGSEYRVLESGAGSSGSSSHLGPYAEGTLYYKYTPRSTLTGSFRLGSEPSGGSGVTRQTVRVGLSASHELGSRLSFAVGLGAERDYYDQSGNGANFTQDIYSASFSVRYKIALATSLVLNDNYLSFQSSLPNSSYTRNFISLGLEASF